MAVAPISGFAAVASAGTLRAGGGPQAGGRAFSEVISRLVTDANSQQIKADQTLEQFATGQLDNVQDLVLATAQADLSFRLVLEVRNRLMEAYQEITRMQV
jgi:flagellar hook-basal body complex protein FliE